MFWVDFFRFFFSGRGGEGEEGEGRKGEDHTACWITHYYS